MFKVLVSPHAAREYEKLPSGVKPRVQAALDALKHNPLSGSKVKRLKGRLREYHRYRVDDYRVIYTTSQKERVVWVDCIQPRKDAY